MENRIQVRKFFVSLNFRADSALSKKIDGFKKRYDPKYRQRSFPHMALLKPFEIQPKDKTTMIEELKEELETFFYGHGSLKLGFKGVGVFQHKRSHVVHLNPVFNEDLEHCQELVLDICKSFIPLNMKYRPNESQFLPLGYFDDHLSLIEVLEQVKLEFSRNSELSIESISLNEYVNGQWNRVELEKRNI
jgi:2'-5' RNA ligase